MFNLFKKKSVIKESEIIFPSAQEMLEKTQENWELKTSKVILEGIERESAIGNRCARFYNARISKQMCEKLREKGYQIEEDTSVNAPYFKISW